MDDESTPMTAVRGDSVASKRQATREATVKHTFSGVSYISFADNSSDDAARLPFMATLADIEHRYGAGNRLYYNLLMFAVFCNAILLIPGVVE